MSKSGLDIIHVIGGGAVGGTFAALLARQGHPVVVVDRDANHVRAICDAGIHIHGGLTLCQPLKAVTMLEPLERPRHVVVAVKAHATSSVIESLAGRLAEDAAIAFVQNGIGLYEGGSIVTSDRIVGVTTSLGAFRDGPGRIKFSGFGRLYAGLPGGRSPTAEFLMKALLSVHPSGKRSSNVDGHIWGKLALGAVYALSALHDVDFLELLDDATFVSDASSLAREIATVAAACGVSLEAVEGWHPACFLSEDIDAQRASWDAQRNSWTSHTQRRAGIWLDLAVNRRRTEVAALFEPVRSRAAAAGLAVPLLSALLARFSDREKTLGLSDNIISGCGIDVPDLDLTIRKELQ